MQEGKITRKCKKVEYWIDLFFCFFFLGISLILVGQIIDRQLVEANSG